MPDDLRDQQVTLPPTPPAAGQDAAPGPPPRRWARRLLIGLNVFVAVCLVGAGLGYGYLRYRLAQLKTARCPSCSAPTGPTTGGLTAMNILLIGSNTRTGLDPSEASQFGSASQVPGARSDVTMILHLDPATGAASLLSIPRDLFVPLPAHSMAGHVGKIDAALNDGPDNLIAAITNDLGIPVNHYVEVNFDGFRRTIDAIGGIRMNFPTPLRDPLSGLSIAQSGCRTLDGATALAVVRARHLQYLSNGRWADDPLSDLARIRRDHTFLRIFVTAAKAQATNPLHANALIGGLLNQVTVDSGLNIRTFVDLFGRYRHLDPNTVAETTLPITVVPNYHYGGGAYGDVDFPVEPLDHQVIAAWGGAPSIAPLAAGSAAAPAGDAWDSVSVVNMSGSRSKATAITTGLSALGYRVGPITAEGVPAANVETVIGYHPGAVTQAVGLLDRLSGAVMLDPNPAVPDGTLSLRIGSALALDNPTAAAGAPAPGGATPATAALGAPSPATAVPTTSIPTALHDTPSSAQDQPQPFDPTACA